MRSHSPEPWAGACSHATALDPTDIKRCGNPNRSASKGDQRGGFGQAGGNRRHAKRRKPSPSTSEGSGARLRPDPEARGHTGRRPKRRLRPSRRGPEGGEGKARQVQARRKAAGRGFGQTLWQEGTSKGDQRGGFGRVGGDRRMARQGTSNPSAPEGNVRRLRPRRGARRHVSGRPKRRLRPKRRGPEGGKEEAPAKSRQPKATRGGFGRDAGQEGAGKRHAKSVLRTGSDPTTTGGNPSGKPKAVQ
jgi:hypothetical protein